MISLFTNIYFTLRCIIKNCSFATRRVRCYYFNKIIRSGDFSLNFTKISKHKQANRALCAKEHTLFQQNDLGVTNFQLSNKNLNAENYEQFLIQSFSHFHHIIRMVWVYACYDELFHTSASVEKKLRFLVNYIFRYSTSNMCGTQAEIL